MITKLMYITRPQMFMRGYRKRMWILTTYTSAEQTKVIYHVYGMKAWYAGHHVPDTKFRRLSSYSDCNEDGWGGGGGGK
jgi:hypothetical protein